MDMNRKLYLIRRKIIRMMLFVLNPVKRADLLRRSGYFKHVGKNVWYTPVNIPTEGQMVSIGDNTVIASGACLVTHDEIDKALKSDKGQEFIHIIGSIDIGNNVFIGQNAIILPNISIGDEAIVAAGSVVTKNIPAGEVWGGYRLVT